MTTCKVNVTGKDGGEVEMSGDPGTIALIERALAYAGARWNTDVQCWDFGFYNTPGDGTHVGNAARFLVEMRDQTLMTRHQCEHGLMKAVESAEAHLREIAK